MQRKKANNSVIYIWYRIIVAGWKEPTANYLYNFYTYITSFSISIFTISFCLSYNQQKKDRRHIFVYVTLLIRIIILWAGNKMKIFHLFHFAMLIYDKLVKLVLWICMCMMIVNVHTNNITTESIEMWLVAVMKWLSLVKT